MFSINNKQQNSVGNSLNIKSNNISFGRIPKHYNTARKVVKEIRSTYLASNTMLEYRRDKIFSKVGPVYKNSKLGILYEKLQKLLNNYESRIGLVRNDLKYKHFRNFQCVIDVIGASVHKNKVANCMEHAYLCRGKLADKYINAHTFCIDVIDINSGKRVSGMGHAFAVANLKKEAEINNLNTWGKDALIVDSWFNTVGRARDVMQHFVAEFGIDLNNHIIIIKKQNDNRKFTPKHLLLTKGAISNYNKAIANLENKIKNQIDVNVQDLKNLESLKEFKIFDSNQKKIYKT